MKDKRENGIHPESYEREYTIQTDDLNKERVSGNSVDEHVRQEAANTMLGKEEVRQQNENL
ncbi:hypothetical protein [Bacillus kexueae]|uniref:hypothetical protein n=1 Tax=Aeribacillus kexueae TaxID=2078952 RepID=UPI001FAFEF04|nr:hypothetical protein [Bacillus kexueae]